MSTIAAPIQIGLLLLSTTATGVICFLCGRSTICSKINNTESQTKHQNARSGCYKNLFICISACVAAFLMVLFYIDNSLIHFSNSPTQFLMQNSSAPTQLAPRLSSRYGFSSPEDKLRTRQAHLCGTHICPEVILWNILAPKCGSARLQLKERK